MLPPISFVDKSLNESFVDFGWWKVRAGNPKRKNKNPKIPEFPKGPHMQSISAGAKAVAYGQRHNAATKV